MLAIGGDLTAPRLLAAYERGIFPGTRRGSDSVVVARSACGAVPGRVSSQPQPETLLRHDPFRITLNHDFAAVIAACAHRPDEGTWIGPEVQRAYQHLHRLGYAHSVEVWQDDQLVGGMYGVAQGALFCGESMFSRVTNASKCALMAFCRHFAAYGGELIDCQVLNAHTARLGAREIPRRQFCSSSAPFNGGLWRRRAGSRKLYPHSRLNRPLQ